MRRRPAPIHAHRSPPGFTLLELLLAITILGVGLLALAAGSAATLRAMNASRTEHEASWRAARRLERLRALPCAIRTSGAERVAGIDEAWTVTPRTDGRATALAVDIAVQGAGTGGRPTRVRFESVAPCPGPPTPAVP